MNGAVQSYLAYDGLGQLALVSPQVGVPKLDYLMIADGVPHFEFNSVTGLLRRHVHGPGSDEPLLTYEGTGTSDKRYLHADERGSIIATSNASGQVTQINAYDDYGIPQGKTPSGAVSAGGTATSSFGRFGYTGQAWLPEVGLYHYKARAYSPTLGRFMQTDPIGYGDGVNLYAYVGGDPVNFVDPSGLKSDIVTGSLIRQDGGGVCSSCSGTSRLNFDSPRGSGGGGSRATSGASTTNATTSPAAADLPGTIIVNGGLSPGGNFSFDGPLGGLITVSGGLNRPTSRIFGSLDDIGELFSNSIDGFRLGRAGELAARSRFLREGRLIAGEQVFVRTALGGLRITDFLLTDGKGNFAGAEIKVNSATRSFNQLFNDGIIASQGGTIVSRGPLGFGLTAGTMIRFDTFELNVTITR